MFNFDSLYYNFPFFVTPSDGNFVKKLKLFLFSRQLGENYYTHLTTYIDQKSLTGIKPDIPGALTMRYVIKKMS